MECLLLAPSPPGEGLRIRRQITVQKIIKVQTISMSKNKNTKGLGSLVYSTDPNFKLEEKSQEQVETIAPAQQKLRIRLDTRHRAGKAVTLVEGFTGSDADCEALGKSLKSFCGTGGAVKDREIIVQGDHRDKVLQWLLKQGYALSKKI